MREDKFRRWIKKEIETEAAALEKHAGENEELSSLQMPEDSFADLMQRIEAREKAEADVGKGRAGSAGAKVFHLRRRTLIAVALVAVLLVGTGIGVAGERLFEPEVVGEIEDGEYNVKILSGDKETYLKVTEEEAYEEIEERLGILALRLGYKPQGMELVNTYIDENMGEAQMEFSYEGCVLRIYENKQSSNAIFDVKVDGKVIDSVEMFYSNREELSVLEMDGDGNTPFYVTQLNRGNAYYRITSKMELNDFEEILKEVFFADI